MTTIDEAKARRDAARAALADEFSKWVSGIPYNGPVQRLLDAFAAAERELAVAEIRGEQSADRAEVVAYAVATCAAEAIPEEDGRLWDSAEDAEEYVVVEDGEHVYRVTTVATLVGQARAPSPRRKGGNLSLQVEELARERMELAARVEPLTEEERQDVMDRWHGCNGMLRDLIAIAAEAQRKKMGKT